MAKCFIDIEASGLDPHSDVPLEIGLVLTDDRFETIYEAETLLSYSDSLIDEIYDESHPRVQRMHEQNGLWHALRTAGDDAAGDIETWLIDQFDAIEEAGLATLKSTPIAGFNPFFDRRWLDEWAPAAIRRLHYRSFDCSTLRAVAMDHGLGDAPRQAAECIPSVIAHRALGDCHAARLYAEWLLSKKLGLF